MIHRPIQPERGSIPALRIGAVQYLNTKPLVHGLSAAGEIV